MSAGAAVDMFDIVVVGGGLVGSAVAWGAARLGQTVVLIDEGDLAFRASRGNFGQVWVQGKGDGHPPYAQLTRRSARLWRRFAEELEAASGVTIEFTQPGGVSFCLSEDELAAATAMVERLESDNEPIGIRMIDRAELAERVPLPIGPQALGACYCPIDGHVNPMRLLRALQQGLQRLGGRYVSSAPVDAVEACADGFVARSGVLKFTGRKLVLAAGLGSEPLASMVELNMPLTPLKGQILVTERVQPLGDLLTQGVRQTQDGTLLLGGTREDVGFRVESTSAGMASVAARCSAMFPAIGKLTVVRSWGCLRVMTPDGRPIYEQSRRHPGAFAVTCHSGVTLAAAHAYEIAASIVDGGFGEAVASLTSERFHAQAA